MTLGIISIATTGNGGRFFLPHNFAAEWGKKNIPKIWKKIFFSSLNILAMCDNGLLQTSLTL